MEPKIKGHGIKYIFAESRMDRAKCPECGFVSNIVKGNWKSVWMIGDEGKEVGVGYECSHCLCKFEYIKS
jgi:hypothetical protein